MKEMDKIQEAILSKVQVEARDIIKEAEEKAREEIARAESQRQANLDEKKSKIIEKAQGEAARILAQASIGARHELLAAKTDIINEIIDESRDALAKTSSNSNSLSNLTREAISGLGVEKAVIYVSPRDKSAAQEMVKADKELAGKIAEIKEHHYTGGVIAEDIDARVRIDNTFETRLEMLLPKFLPEISKGLF